MPLLFKIKPPRGQRPKGQPPFFVLEQDNWNDYSFQTLYHLSYCSKDVSGSIDESLIGPLKILKRGQTPQDKIVVVADFEQLSDDFCSVGQSLDYYERLNSLGGNLKAEVLSALRDVVQTPSLVDIFRNEEGWSISLFRDQSDAGHGFLTLARGLLTGDYAKVPSGSMEFSFEIPGWQAPIEFRFDAPRIPSSGWHGESVLPERIAVLVGRNGSGKSTFLARLARVAFGTLDERAKLPLTDLGLLRPTEVGFPRIVTISFSAFDSFKLPGSDGRNQRQVIKDLERGEGRFSFIGIRDVVAEWSSLSSASVGVGNDDAPLAEDRLGRTHLKSIDQLANEFVLYLQKIHTKERNTILEDILQDLFAEPVFQDFSVSAIQDSQGDAKARFLAYSTGHKIALLIVVGLLANIEPYSLVLFDEPESHLHPPLLAALMHALRAILDKHEAFAIVATHSPVVVQESLARHVRVVRREGDMTNVVPVGGETFGESIGLISAEVFGLQSEATDFHKILDRLIRLGLDLESIESLFLDEAMSHQARAYVMSRLDSSKKN